MGYGTAGEPTRQRRRALVGQEEPGLPGVGCVGAGLPLLGCADRAASGGM